MRNLVVGVRGTHVKERFKFHFSALVNLIFLKYTVKLYQFKLRRMHELHVAIIDMGETHSLVNKNRYAGI